MRLSIRLRWALYGVFAVLVLTGAAWLAADRLKDSDDGEVWQRLAADLLMAHGGAAMIALLFLGALGPLHVQRAWRSGMNRATGIAVVSLNALLIATAFALYYLGSEALRPWISDIHIALGLGLPFLLAGHIALGRKRARHGKAMRCGRAEPDETSRTAGAPPEPGDSPPPPKRRETRFCRRRKRSSIRIARN